MDRKEIKDNFGEILHQSFNIGCNERKLILEVIDQLENVKGKDKTEKMLADKCRSVYQILRSKDIFRDFIALLKEEKKLGDFSNTSH